TWGRAEDGGVGAPPPARPSPLRRSWGSAEGGLNPVEKILTGPRGQTGIGEGVRLPAVGTGSCSAAIGASAAALPVPIDAGAAAAVVVPAATGVCALAPAVATGASAPAVPP